MRVTLERSAGPVDQDVPAVQGGAAYRTARERRLAPYGERAEPRPRAVAYRRGLRSPAARTHSWQWADGSGDATPSGWPHLLRRVRWAPEAGRDERHRASVQHLGAAAAVWGLDATGWLNKGRQAVRVTRQYRRTAGRLDNGRIGGLVGDASRHGQAVLDRERDLPAAWTIDRGRCQHAGLPADRGVATQPALAKEMRQRTLVAGGLAQWVTGDRG